MPRWKPAPTSFITIATRVTTPASTTMDGVSAWRSTRKSKRDEEDRGEDDRATEPLPQIPAVGEGDLPDQTRHEGPHDPGQSDQSATSWTGR